MATKDSSSSKELLASLPGLVLKFNTLEDEGEVSRLLTLVDSIFAVSIIESQENVMKIESRIGDEQMMYYSNPYEQFCKENWSFLSKYLRQAKMDQGLDFLLENFGF